MFYACPEQSAIVWCCLYDFSGFAVNKSLYRLYLKRFGSMLLICEQYVLGGSALSGYFENSTSEAVWQKGSILYTVYVKRFDSKVCVCVWGGGRDSLLLKAPDS